jgi:predicted DNA-binding transcriptional regulator YafY
VDRTERFYKIDNQLNSKGVVPVADLLEVLEVSLATFKRDIEYMRDRLNSPIVWDRDARGYRYDRGVGAGPQALPGLWFNASEAHALLMMQALLSDLQPTLLRAQVAPLKARLRALIETGQHPAADVEHRFRLLHSGQRPVQPQHFETVATALLRRQRLKITYHVRSRNEQSEREVSPQVVVHYKGNWYLVAWCHMRKGLRSFALDSIESAWSMGQEAKEVGRQTLERFVGQGYGIFSGEEVQWATLRFSPERARWVAQEVWHPQQTLTPLPDGRLDMRLPYTDLRELSMDVLRHGAHVEALEPPELRQALLEELARAQRQYTLPEHPIQALKD